MSEINIKTKGSIDFKEKSFTPTEIGLWIQGNDDGSKIIKDETIAFVLAHKDFIEENLTAKYHSGTFLSLGMDRPKLLELFDLHDDFKEKYNALSPELQERSVWLVKNGKGFSRKIPESYDQAIEWAKEEVNSLQDRKKEETDKENKAEKDNIQLSKDVDNLINYIKNSTVSKGTEKQINWAKKLREELIWQLENKKKNANKSIDEVSRNYSYKNIINEIDNIKDYLTDSIFYINTHLGKSYTPEKKEEIKQEVSFNPEMTTFEKFAKETNITNEPDYNIYKELFNDAFRIAKNIDSIDLSKESSSSAYLAVSALRENNEKIKYVEYGFKVESKYNFRFVDEKMVSLLAKELLNSNLSEKYNIPVEEIKTAIEIESEHKDTLQKVYDHEITPDEAIIKTVTDHLGENKDYYDKEIGLPAMEEKLKENKTLDELIPKINSIIDDVINSQTPDKWLAEISVPSYIKYFFGSLKKSEVSFGTWAIYGKGFVPKTAKLITTYFNAILGYHSRGNDYTLNKLKINIDEIDKAKSGKGNIIYKNGIMLSLVNGNYKSEQYYFYAGTQINIKNFVFNEIMNLLNENNISNINPYSLINSRFTPVNSYKDISNNEDNDWESDLSNEQNQMSIEEKLKTYYSIKKQYGGGYYIDLIIEYKNKLITKKQSIWEFIDKIPSNYRLLKKSEIDIIKENIKIGADKVWIDRLDYIEDTLKNIDEIYNSIIKKESDIEKSASFFESNTIKIKDLGVGFIINKYQVENNEIVGNIILKITKIYDSFADGVVVSFSGKIIDYDEVIIGEEITEVVRDVFIGKIMDTTEIKINSKDYNKQQLSDLCKQADKEQKRIIADVEDELIGYYESLGFKKQL